jgi:hypothetical protein
MTTVATGLRPRRRWIWVLVALATAGVVIIPVTLRIALKAAIHHEFGPAVTYRRDVTALSVQADAGGSVTIRPDRDGRVVITRALQWVFGKPSVTQSWQDGVLHVGATCPKFNPFEDCEADVTISVPAGTAVTAQADGGSVVVSGMSGPLHLAATSGLLQVGRVSGPLWLSATSGFVVGRLGISSPQVYASVTTGSIALRLAAEPRFLTLGVGSGYANVVVPRGARYRIAGSYAPGTLQIAPGLSDASSGRLLTVRLGTGEVKVGYTLASGHA